MNSKNTLSALLAASALLAPAATLAEIPGITGRETAANCGNDSGGQPIDRCFSLTAHTGHIALGDGNSLLIWGYSDDDNPILAKDSSGVPIPGAVLPQYPGPTLFAREGERVRVTLHNALTRKMDTAGTIATPPASIVFPGLAGVVAEGGTAGTLTREAGTGSAVTYTFVASRPGTFLYQSGSQPELQIEMGMVGGLIVRPAGVTAAAPRAYGGAGSAYDREYLYLLTEIDRAAHEAVEFGYPVDPAAFKATLWFINGRNGPDTLIEAPEDDTATSPAVGWFPAQPYNALTRMAAGERLLARLINAGRDLHPFHHHGNNAWVIARDARVQESAANAEVPYPDFQFNNVELVAKGATLPDEAASNYTVQAVPGATYDFIWTWTGKQLGWDPYGTGTRYAADNTTVTHGCGADNRLMPGEDADSHCKGLPVTLPETQALTLGGLWSGSPELGVTGPLPPGEGGLNPAGGYTFMWHSHTERELTNDDVFPGGMMTMMIVEAPLQLPAEPVGHLIP
jgi:manganese oxidase